MNRLKVALAYLERGWSFYPTYPKSKLPYAEICPQWTPYRDTLPSRFDVETWFLIAPNANMALITGPLSNLCIVECDSEDAARKFCELCGCETLTDFGTPFVKSRRGYHVYFERPNAPDVRASKQRIERELGIDDLELKADLNCCTAPPSVHESGWQYKFINSPHRFELQPLPEAMAEVATRPREEVPLVAPGAYSLSDCHSAYGRAALRNACTQLSNAQSHRNDALNYAALSMGRLVASGVLDESTVRAALCASAAQTGLSAREIRDTFNSGFYDGMEQPRAIPQRQTQRPTKRPRTLSQLKGGAFA